MDVFFLLSFFVEEREFDQSMPFDEAGAILAFAVKLLSECIVSEDQQSDGYHVAELINHLSRVVGCSRRNISFLIDRCQLLRYIHAVLVDRIPSSSPALAASPTTSGTFNTLGTAGSGSGPGPGPGTGTGTGTGSGRSSPRLRCRLRSGSGSCSSPAITPSANSPNTISSSAKADAGSPASPAHQSSTSERPAADVKTARFSKRAKLHAAVCCLHIALDEKNRSRLAEYGELLSGAPFENTQSIYRSIYVTCTVHKY